MEISRLENSQKVSALMLSPSARALEDDVSASVAEVQHRVKSIRHESVCVCVPCACTLPECSSSSLCLPLPLSIFLSLSTS